MLVKSRKPWELPYSDVTPEAVYRSRRDFIKIAAAGALGVAAASPWGAVEAAQAPPLPAAKKSAFVTDPAVNPLNTFETITSYNNYYEFGTRKSDPAMYAPKLTTRPWTVKIDGLVAKPGDWAIDDLIKQNELEERVYRHRCVERWSYVIPWIGFPLKSLLDKVQPTSAAKYVEFTTLVRESEMPFLKNNIDFPYVEGLRMDEARHPLTLMVVGLYGKPVPNQNGAPIRVHVPWKYGFKSGKSIVRIRFTADEPKNTWQVQNAAEYGFYANVNPEVDHPRWSQKFERRLPNPFFDRPTVKFNGYGDQVASLYTGMDLRKFY